MAKKKSTENFLNIENILFNCRDILRAARNSGSFFEKRDMMLTLIFLRFIGEKYEDGSINLLEEARWSTIINTPGPQLNVALDTALHSIARSF